MVCGADSRPLACVLFSSEAQHTPLRRSIADGERVEVASRVGRIEVSAEVTSDIEPGVVSLPHGWGHGRAGVRLAVAAAHAGASINDLVDDQRVDALTGTAVLNGTPVEVEATATGP